MIHVESWLDVVEVLEREPRATRIRVPKAWLPPPAEVGMRRSVGLPLGQQIDYRYPLRAGVGLHVQDFGQYFEAWLDREARAWTGSRPEASIGPMVGVVAAGAAMGAAVGQSGHGAIAGAAVASLAGVLASWLATLDDEVPMPN